MLKIDSKPENRVVVLTVIMVALAGLLVSAAFYIRTRSLIASYDGAMKTELQQKGLAYGQTAQSLLSSFASTSPEAFQSLLGRAANDPGSLISSFNADQPGQFQNVPLGFEVWAQSPSAPAGYTLLFRRDFPGGRSTTSEDPGIPSLVAQTAATGGPVAALNKDDTDLHYSFLIQANGQANLMVVATLDASEEFTFFDAQADKGIRSSIILAAGSIMFLIVVGGGLSYAVSRTLTNRKRAEEALRDSELRYRTLANLSPVGIFRNDREGNNIYNNQRALEIAGVPSDAAMGEGWARSLHPDDRERVLSEWGEAIAQGLPFKSEYRFLHADGTTLWVLGQVAAERTTHGDVVGYVGTVTDITERKQTEETLREQSRHDQLTGSLNHAAMIEELQRLIASESDERCAVAMIDVDGMKALNDTYGHLIGDQALQAIARILEKNGAVVGRYGGDEFIAVLPGADRDDAERYRGEVLAALAQTKLNDPDTRAQVPLAASIGFAIYPEEAATIVDLIKLADSAMYAHRRQRPIAPDSRPRRSSADDHAARLVGEIVPLLTSPGNIRSKLRFVAHRLLLSLGHDAVTAVLFSPQPGGAALSCTVARVDEALVQAWDDDQGQEGVASILRALLEEVQRPFIISDLPHDERLSPSQRELLVRAGLVSGLVVPMIWQGQTLGALAIGSRQAAAFGPADAQLVNAVAGQVTAIVRMSSLVDELQTASAQRTKTQEETVLLLAAAAEAHDGATGRHLQRVQALVEALARELGTPYEEARALGMAAVLHDIGKLFVPETVLASAGPLDGAGWVLMKRHTTLGEQFLNGHTSFEPAATIARHHHERWDGTGYPDGLAGVDIPAAATIVTVADAYDAMTSGRPYRGPLSLESAIAEILACSGTQFSPRVVEALLRLHQRGELPMVEGEARRAA
jgi:diguanylate cyclase (GGDEF)-like protein/PAS domain S-box-containing protein